MQLTGKFLVAGLAASLGAVVVPLSCAVDDRPPGLPNEVPNLPGHGSGTGSSGGPANLCECAAAVFDDTLEACQLCWHDASGPDGGCGSEALSWQTCSMSDPECTTLNDALNACYVAGSGPDCIAAAMAATPAAAYLAFASCTCAACGPECTLGVAPACNLADGGAPDAADPDAADGSG